MRQFLPALALASLAFAPTRSQAQDSTKAPTVEAAVGTSVAEKALVGAEDLDLRPEELEPILPLAQAKEEFQKRYISEVLERNGGNRTKTAKDLDVDPRTIFRHLEKLEAERQEPRPTGEEPQP